MTDQPQADALERALEAEESGELDAIVRAREPEALAGLRALVRDPAVDPGRRAKAIYALGRWRDEDSVDAIISLLPTLDERGRIAAVEALGRIGGPKALGAVIDQAESESPQVRKFVVRALARFRQPEAQERLREMEANDGAEFVRQAARDRSGG
jgi:HEAT repeat protein